MTSATRRSAEAESTPSEKESATTARANILPVRRLRAVRCGGFLSLDDCMASEDIGRNLQPVVEGHHTHAELFVIDAQIPARSFQNRLRIDRHDFLSHHADEERTTPDILEAVERETIGGRADATNTPLQSTIGPAAAAATAATAATAMLHKLVLDRRSDWHRAHRLRLSDAHRRRTQFPVGAQNVTRRTGRPRRRVSPGGGRLRMKARVLEDGPRGMSRAMRYNRRRGRRRRGGLRRREFKSVRAQVDDLNAFVRWVLRGANPSESECHQTAPRHAVHRRKRIDNRFRPEIGQIKIVLVRTNRIGMNADEETR